jgi:hypothetical protein
MVLPKFPLLLKFKIWFQVSWASQLFRTSHSNYTKGPNAHFGMARG